MPASHEAHEGVDCDLVTTAKEMKKENEEKKEKEKKTKKKKTKKKTHRI